MANKNRVRNLFLDLVRINSPSKQERGIADYVKAKLSDLGFRVEEDDTGSKINGSAGNVIAFKKGNAVGARAIFFCCHMDTVEPTDKLNLVIEDDVIKSDGTTILGADDKAGIAAVIEGIESILESGKPHGDIQVLFDVSEEIGLLGAKNLDLSKIKADLGYVFDTHKPVAGITLSAPTHEVVTVEIHGKAAHAGIAPEKGISAIVAASRAIAGMKLGRIDEETTANVGIISGGKARNIIPDHVAIKGEARSRNESKLVAQVEHMKRLFEEEAAKIGARAVVETTREYTGFRWTENDEVVKLAAEASRRIGIEPSYHDGGGGSDANIFNNAGIPCVVIGVGYENPHATNEYINVGDLAKAADYVAALVQTASENPNLR